MLLPDQRGHGRSSRFEGEGPWPQLSVPTLASDALALLDAASPGAPAHFVGASMGGMVAARIAAERPDRVASLTLWATPPRPDPGWIAYFRDTLPEALPAATQKLSAYWHGEPYWRTLARGLFAHFSAAPSDAFDARPRPPRALVAQADDDELLARDDPDVWRARIDAPTRIERLPRGGHAFFADGGAGTIAARRMLRAFLDEG